MTVLQVYERIEKLLPYKLFDVGEVHSEPLPYCTMSAYGEETNFYKISGVCDSKDMAKFMLYEIEEILSSDVFECSPTVSNITMYEKDLFVCGTMVKVKKRIFSTEELHTILKKICNKLGWDSSRLK